MKPTFTRFLLDETEDGVALLPVNRGLEFETLAASFLCLTDDMKVGTKAFLEKTKPDFTGK